MRKKYEFTVVIEKDEDGMLVGSVPELKGCYTQSKSLDSLLKRIREVIDLCLEVERDIEPVEFVGIQKVALYK